jgi:DNA-binding NarL/FixJ family response regulator
MDDFIKVMIVDDHESMRNAFEYEFRPENGYEVVSSIASATDAAQECLQKQIDLVIMDVCTENNASGLEAAAKIIQQSPEIKVIVTSGFDEITYAPRAKELGAHAFVFKNKSCSYFRDVAGRVLAGGRSFPEQQIIPLPQGEAPFTDREMEILRLKCKNMKTSDIASELFITKNTVNRHVQNMLAKSGFSSMMELVVYVVSNGWINPNY